MIPDSVVLSIVCVFFLRFLKHLAMLFSFAVFDALEKFKNDTCVYNVTLIVMKYDIIGFSADHSLNHPQYNLKLQMM